MNNNRFDPKKLHKLNNPQRLVDIPPDYIRDKIHVEKSGVLVEIGAGTAFFCIAFLPQFKPSKIFACDVSEAMIDWIKENVSPKHPEIVPVATNGHSVPLDDGIADLVYMIAVHHELEDPALTLSESYNILKPGREIFIIDWKKEDMPEGPPPEKRCLPEHVEHQLVDAGFQDVKIYNEMKKHFLVVGKKV